VASRTLLLVHQQVAVGAQSSGVVLSLWVPWGLLFSMYSVGVKTSLGFSVEPGRQW